MNELKFNNGKTIKINTIAIKYSKFEEAEDKWIKNFSLWALYLHIIANGSNPLQQTTLPGVLESIATYLGSVKFTDKTIHFWFFIVNENDSEMLESAHIIITDSNHNVLKQLIIEGKFNYES